MNQYENGRNSGTGTLQGQEHILFRQWKKHFCWETDEEQRPEAGRSSASSSRSTSTRSTSGRTGRGSSGSSTRRSTGSSARTSSSQVWIVIIMKQDRPSSGRHGGRRGGPDFRKIAIGGVILVLAIFCVAFLMKKVTGSRNNEYGAGNRDYRS